MHPPTSFQNEPYRDLAVRPVAPIISCICSPVIPRSCSETSGIEPIQPRTDRIYLFVLCEKFFDGFFFCIRVLPGFVFQPYIDSIRQHVLYVEILPPSGLAFFLSFLLQSGIV
jgi:hypothetical protein